MNEAKFILSKKRLREQVEKLKDLNLKISYSYKTNKIVGNLLEEMYQDMDLSVHDLKEIGEVKEIKRVWFFTQAESKRELSGSLEKGVRKFVVDNVVDLQNLLETIQEKKEKIQLSLRMKFQEHRVGTGRYFVYGMSAKKVNEIIDKIHHNPFIERLGVHIHRKSQNTSEWEIKEEIEDSLSEKNFERIDFINLGGGLPIQYKNYSSSLDIYIFSKIKEVVDWMSKNGKDIYIEPGRFLAGPCIKLVTSILQVYEKTVVINTSIYKCALDTHLTETKMIIEGELEEGKGYTIKGNSPTRDDIFRYKVRLSEPRTGDDIVFINAGAYNYTTDFFGYKKLETVIVE